MSIDLPIQQDDLVIYPFSRMILIVSLPALTGPLTRF